MARLMRVKRETQKNWTAFFHPALHILCFTFHVSLLTLYALRRGKCPI